MGSEKLKIQVLLFKYCLWCLCLLFANNIFGQELPERRILRVWAEKGDTMLLKHTVDRSGKTKFLSQYYLEYEGKTVFEISEEYKRNKFWVVFRYKEVLLKKKKEYTQYQQLADGSQLQYNEQGQLIYWDEYKEGEKVRPSIEIIYYPNGNLQFMAEVIDHKYWNYLSYKYPDGTDYDFGDFKDGAGVVVHLNEAGEPCIECTSAINKKTRAKILCDEAE